jgi:hypothetical protein
MGERVGRGLLVGCKVRVMDSVGLRVRGLGLGFVLKIQGRGLIFHFWWLRV